MLSRMDRKGKAPFASGAPIFRQTSAQLATESWSPSTSSPLSRTTKFAPKSFSPDKSSQKKNGDSSVTTRSSQTSLVGTSQKNGSRKVKVEEMMRLLT